MTDPVRTAEELSAQSKHWANYDGRERERGRGMTRSKAVGSAQGLKGKSKPFANYMYHPLGSGKERYAVKAEDRFFEWLWKRERKGGRNG